MAALLVAKLKTGGRVLFFSGSFAFDKAEAVAAQLLAHGLVSVEPAYKSLRIFRKVTS